jgi:hypothetical protein
MALKAAALNKLIPRRRIGNYCAEALGWLGQLFDGGSCEKVSLNSALMNHRECAAAGNRGIA